MPDEKRKLAKTVEALQARFGKRAVRRGVPTTTPLAPAAGTVASGVAALDTALGGGLPRGRLSEIMGAPTSGAATLALRAVAHAPAAAIYVDMDRLFDPDYAARCGVALDRLILVHPRSLAQALAIAQDFLGGDPDIIVLDLPLSLAHTPALMSPLAQGLERLLPVLGRANTALLALVSLPAAPQGSKELDHYPTGLPLSHYAAVRLLLQRERWLYQAHDIHGYRAQAQIVKNKLGRPGRRVTIEVVFDRETP